MNEKQIQDSIAIIASEILKTCTDDYAGRIWEKISDDVIEDVMECSGIDDEGEFSSGDVSLAIGRVLLGRLGDEEWSIYSKS